MFRAPAIAFAAALVSAAVSAQTVYKTVEDGVPTFSDAPPQEGPAEVIEVQVAPPSDDALLAERLEEMREATDRMAADRREREKHRAELRALNAPEPAPERVIVEQPSTVWTGGFWPGYTWPPLLPEPLPQPLPEQPGWSVMQPGNSQLMRSILPPPP